MVLCLYSIIVLLCTAEATQRLVLCVCSCFHYSGCSNHYYYYLLLLLLLLLLLFSICFSIFLGVPGFDCEAQVVHMKFLFQIINIYLILQNLWYCTNGSMGIWDIQSLHPLCIYLNQLWSVSLLELFGVAH